MPNVPFVPSDEASSEVKAVYEEFSQRMSFPAPPNFIKIQGHSSTVVRGTWEVMKNILVNGVIPRWQKEMMFVAISVDRACQYCSAVHLACCRMLGVKPGLLESLVKNIEGIADLKLRDMVKFAVKCARNPQSLHRDDFDSLRIYGLQDREMMEIIAMSALAVYANILADATGVETDPMLEAL